MVALHPRLPNIVKLPGDLNIHVYCGDPLALDFLRELRHPMDELLMTGLDIRSYISSTTTQATELQSIGSEDTFQPTKTELDLYVLWDCPIYSQNGTRTYRALDPWTCQHKIVKLYKSDAGSGLEKRFASVKAMTAHRSIVKYSEIIRIKGVPVLVSPWHDVKPLRVHVEDMSPWCEGVLALLSTARSLMWTLLVLAGHINNCHVVHGDISLDTILVKQLDLDHADILVGGFSECKIVEGVGAFDTSKDSLDVFKTVKSFLKRVEELSDQGSLRLSTRKGWLGHPYLDELWQRADRSEPWKISILDICQRINLRLDDCGQPWRSLTVKRRFDIGIEYGPNGLMLNLTDLIEYIEKDAQQHLNEEDQKEVDAAMRIHLKHKNHSNHCSEAAFWAFSKHVSKRIGKSIGSAMAIELGKELSQTRSGSFLSVMLVFSVTCYLPSRIFNITQLLRPVRSDDLVKAKSLLSGCADYFEVRGNRSLRGIYMPLRYLEKISHVLRLETVELLEQTSAYEGVQLDLTWYDYQHWILLADTAFSIPARLNRTTRVVSWEDDREYQLGDFLREYMPLSVLDIQPHSLDPAEKIFDIPMPKSLETKSMTYNDSCQSEEDTFKFQFKRGDAAGKRTAEWISKIESIRTTRKRLLNSCSEAPKSPSMRPTNFYSSTCAAFKGNESGL